MVYLVDGAFIETFLDGQQAPDPHTLHYDTPQKKRQSCTRSKVVNGQSPKSLSGCCILLNQGAVCHVISGAWVGRKGQPSTTIM